MTARHATHAPEISPLAHQRRQLGALGEQMAARYLEMRGYRILERNWRHRRGELDLIAADGDVIVAVEVKTRTTTDFGHPLEAITRQKLQRLRALISLWCQSRDAQARALRVDAIAILGESGSRRVIDHRKGIA